MICRTDTSTKCYSTKKNETTELTRGCGWSGPDRNTFCISVIHSGHAKQIFEEYQKGTIHVTQAASDFIIFYNMEKASFIHDSKELRCTASIKIETPDIFSKDGAFNTLFIRNQTNE